MVKNLKVEGQSRETRQDDAKLLAPLLDKTEVVECSQHAVQIHRKCQALFVLIPTSHLLHINFSFELPVPSRL